MCQNIDNNPIYSRCFINRIIITITDGFLVRGIVELDNSAIGKAFNRKGIQKN